MANDTPLILQVDDEEDILAVSKLALEAVGGLRIVQCSSGAEALQSAPRENPDLFLVDVMMPHMDGIETLRRLRSIEGFENTPAIFMTAKATAQDREILMRSGAEAVITKPFDPLTVASDIVAIWAASRQSQPGEATEA